MAIATRVMGSGCSAQMANNIVGSVNIGATAAGTTINNALAATTTGTEITTAAVNTGILGLSGNTGDLQWVYNGGANAVKWYPPVGETVNNGAASFSIPINTLTFFIKRKTNAWFSL